MFKETTQVESKKLLTGTRMFLVKAGLALLFLLALEALLVSRITSGLEQKTATSHGYVSFPEVSASVRVHGERRPRIYRVRMALRVASDKRSEIESLTKQLRPLFVDAVQELLSGLEPSDSRLPRDRLRERLKLQFLALFNRVFLEKVPAIRAAYATELADYALRKGDPGQLRQAVHPGPIQAIEFTLLYI